MNTQDLMVDDKTTAYKLILGSVKKSLKYQKDMMDKYGYTHHQGKPQANVFVCVWERSKKIGVFKNETEFHKSNLR